MADLVRELSLLAVDWPATPPLRTAVEGRLAHEVPDGAAPRRAPRLRALPRGLRVALIAALVLLLAAGTVLAASRAAREFFGLQGATVERTTKAPPSLEPQTLGLGRRVSLREARRGAPFPVFLPSSLGDPDAAYVLGEEVSLAYQPRDGLPEARQLGLGLLITQVGGDAPVIGKLAPAATRVQQLRVGAFRAIWIEGAPHFFGYRDPDGSFRRGSLRAAGNVLLVERGEVLVRLEGELSRARAIAIAESLR
jgi:hypothetical protein